MQTICSLRTLVDVLCFCLFSYVSHNTTPGSRFWVLTTATTGEIPPDTSIQRDGYAQRASVRTRSNRPGGQDRNACLLATSPDPRAAPSRPFLLAIPPRTSPLLSRCSCPVRVSTIPGEAPDKRYTRESHLGLSEVPPPSTHVHHRRWPPSSRCGHTSRDARGRYANAAR